MSKGNKIKLLFGIIVMIVGLSLFSMTALAGLNGDMSNKSSQELTKILEKNDASYAKKSEKQMELNKNYKEKIVRFRFGENTDLSKQTLKIINRTTEDVNKNVEKLSDIKNKINISKQSLHSISDEELLRVEKIMIIKNQRKANRLLTRINEDLEVLVALLE